MTLTPEQIAHNLRRLKLDRIFDDRGDAEHALCREAHDAHQKSIASGRAEDVDKYTAAAHAWHEAMADLDKARSDLNRCKPYHKVTE